MCKDTMRREHPLIPLLNSKRVLCSKIELDATVEYATDICRSGAQVHNCTEVDRARNRKYIRILDDRYLPKADARLRNRIGRNETDVDLPRVEHLEHLTRRGLLDVDFQAGSATAAAHERSWQKCLN